MKNEEIKEYIELVFKEKTVLVENEIKELRESLYLELEKQIPEAIKNLSQELKDVFIKQTSEARFMGNGLSYDQSKLNKKIICGSSEGDWHFWKVTDQILEIVCKIGKIQREFKDKKQSLFDIFKNLKTEKRILDVYPEFEGVIIIKKKCEALICKDSDIVNYLKS